MSTTSGQFDWTKIKRRLELLHQSSVEAETLSPEAEDAVLEERARLLARCTNETDQAQEQLELLIFDLEGETFGIETRYVREVTRAESVTALPGAAAFLAGITNLRGEFLAALDLRDFFGLPQTKGRRTQLVVLGEENAELGWLVDLVRDVRNIPVDEIKELPGSLSERSREYLRGVTPEALLIVDGSALLQDERLYIDQDLPIARE